MEDLNGKWTYNFEEAGIWNNDIFDTYEEAVDAGTKHANEEGKDVLYIGQIEMVRLSENAIDVDTILEDLACNLDDEYCSEFEHGDSWYNNITKEEKKLLEEMLNKTFKQWLKKTNNYPTSYTIKDVQKTTYIKEN